MKASITGKELPIMPAYFGAQWVPESMKNNASIIGIDLL